MATFEAVRSRAVGSDPQIDLVLAQLSSAPPVLGFDAARAEPEPVHLIAEVTSVDAWASLPGVDVRTIVGDVEDRGTTLVTAWVQAGALAEIHGSEVVVDLELARPLTPALDHTGPSIRSDLAADPAVPSGLTGKGVVVGVVDFGPDIVHANLRHADGTTRFEVIRRQRVDLDVEAAAIDAALRTPDPYTTSGIVPALDPDGTHGTHVVDIAAGNGNGSGLPGIAPEATLVFVDAHLPGPQRAAAIGRGLGDSVELIEAVHYIFQRAGDRPCVVNVSLGTNSGPHDGSTLFDLSMEIELGQPDRAITIAAGNSHQHGTHTAGRLVAGTPVQLHWRVLQTSLVSPMVEVWHDAGDDVTIRLVDPDGETVGEAGYGDAITVLDQDGRIRAVLSAPERPDKPTRVAGVYLEGGTASGEWIVEVECATPSAGWFHAWIARDDTQRSEFASPDPSTTLGSLSCGGRTIVVGSYDAHAVAEPISPFSSAGPTRDGREKPELSAPGGHVRAACSRSEVGVVEKSGTSMSAPAVAGAIALLYEAAAARGRHLTIDQLRDLLISTARPVATPPATWDPRFGFGRLDIAAAIAQL